MKKRQLRVTGNVQEKVNLAQPHSLPAHGLCAHICLRDSQCSWIMSHIRNSDMPINTGQYRQPTDNQTHDGPVMIHYATESQKFQWYCFIHHSSCSFVTHSPTHPPIHLPTHHPPTPIAISSPIHSPTGKYLQRSFSLPLPGEAAKTFRIVPHSIADWMQYQVREGHKRVIWQTLTQIYILYLWYPKYIFHLPSMLTSTPQRDILQSTHEANWLVICIADTSNLSSLRYVFFLIFKWNNPNLLFYLSGNVFLLSQGDPWTCMVLIQSQEAGLFKQHQKVRTQISLFGSTAGQGDLGSLALVTDGAPLMYLWGFITSKPSLRIPTAGTVLFFQMLNKEVKGLWGIKKIPRSQAFHSAMVAASNLCLPEWSSLTTPFSQYTSRVCMLLWISHDPGSLC